MANFRDKYGPWAIVAGASEGIGRAFSEQLAAAGVNLILLARRTGPLSQLAAQLENDHQIKTRPIAIDLAAADLDAHLAKLANEFEIGLLIYNACFSEVGEFMQTSLTSKLQTLDVNCRGPLIAVSALAPEMVKRRRGGIILMSSMSGFQGSAMVSTYAATKAFNTILGEGLWEELRHHNVDVLSMVAGATKTPNFVAITPEDKQGMTFPMAPEAVARQALRELGRRPTAIAGRLNSAVYFVFSRLVSRQRAVQFFANTTRKVYGQS